VSPSPAFSTDPDRIDADWVHRMLSEHAYWALGRSREVQDAANAGSRVYGMYDDGAQVAFARVVTDGATFAWLCDVIVDPDARGRSVGKMLLAGIVADLEPLGLRRTLLATGDAHGLYEQYGWGPLRTPEKWMERPA
jgi:GNAT superfamily N-acetyltransferase